VAYAIVAVALSGIVLGLRFKVPALLAASLATIVARVALHGLAQPIGWNIVVSTVVLVAVLQLSFLIGLFLASVVNKATFIQRR
jgi:hypothetical protein